MAPTLDSHSLLTTPPPLVTVETARAVARFEYGLDGECFPLSGERDRNFVVSRTENAYENADGGKGVRFVLKFINAAESSEETACQVALLRHLAESPCAFLAPVALRTRSRKDTFALRGLDTPPIQGRAYSYLEGQPATEIVTDRAHRQSLACALAMFDQALTGFSHPGSERPLLWDLMRLGSLRPFVDHIDDGVLRDFVREFLDAFTGRLTPKLTKLRHQVIHNDLSKSNFLYDPADGATVCGILDFGDLAYAPLIADLAIAASYQINDADDPLTALEEMIAAFHSVLPLSLEERDHVLDLVMARLVQRLIITEWRAASFPENRVYILRHNPQARELLNRLMSHWRETTRGG